MPVAAMPAAKVRRVNFSPDFAGRFILRLMLLLPQFLITVLIGFLLSH
jgi:hypothetical protein